jgi:hypothetical protein
MPFVRAASVPLSIINGKNVEKKVEKADRQTLCSHKKVAVEQQIASSGTCPTNHINLEVRTDLPAASSHEKQSTEQIFAQGHPISADGEQELKGSSIRTARPAGSVAVPACVLSVTSGRSEAEGPEYQTHGTQASVLGRSSVLRSDSAQLSSEAKATSVKNRIDSVSSGSTFCNTISAISTVEHSLGPKSPYSSCTSYASQLYVLNNIDENEPKSFFDWSGYGDEDESTPAGILKRR